MNKETLSEFAEFAQKSNELSRKMTKAWLGMVGSGQVKRYLGTSDERLDRSAKGKQREEKDHVVEYRKSLKNWLELSSKNLP